MLASIFRATQKCSLFVTIAILEMNMIEPAFICQTEIVGFQIYALTIEDQRTENHNVIADHNIGVLGSSQ